MNVNMKSVNTVRKISTIRTYIGFLIVGLVFAAVAGWMIYQRAQVETYPVQATIQEIYVETDAEGDNDYTVILDYKDKYNVAHNGVAYHGFQTGWHKGDVIEINVDVNDPENIYASGESTLIYILLVVGLGCAAWAIYGIVKAGKTKLEDMNEFDRVKKEEITPEQIEAIKNDDSPENEYYFHYTGKLGQSYVLETPSRSEQFLGRCDKMGFGFPSTYTFENCRTGSQKTSKVSATVTTRNGSGNGIGSSTVYITESSYFKIDGVKCWDVIGQLGYSFEPHLNGLHYSMTVFRYGVEVGTIDAAGSNILRDDKQYKLGNLPAKGLYVVHCRETDLEGFFMICFAMARTEC